ncbi:hypothetical protein BU15DRAFT_72848 [Melanogaster broomeanus]|nr:hypothetical protein BU15DRAFT_72848 [Melanogaster broomeanus]
MSDVESTPKDTKKARIELSPETSTKRDSSRDTKRRKRKKKKAAIVGAGETRRETTPRRTDERPPSQRAPLSARNEITRFTSAAPETASPSGASSTAGVSMQGSAPIPVSKSGSGDHSSRSSGDNLDVEPAGKTISSSPRGKKMDTVARLTRELKSKNDLIASHQALLNQVQQAVTCQICLDLMYKPYGLAPCGHLACYSCLVQWFNALPPDNRPVPPAIVRKKTCPHCRAVVRERPIEIPVPIDPPENLNANSDPWKDIFPKAGGAGHPRFPWFFPGADIDEDDDVPIANIAQNGEDVGMLDMEDGGIYRCLDCMHEIWDGICTSCGRVYPGHRHDVDDDDDDDDDPIWFDHQMVAEEVDMADDPGWMGLEGGNGDDDGDDEHWRDHFDAPWRHRMHMFGGPLLGSIPTVRVEGSDDEEDGPRIYEISEDSDSGITIAHHPMFDTASDDHEDEGYHVHERRLDVSTRAALVISSDESEDGPESYLGLRRTRTLGGSGGSGGPSRGSRLRWGRGIIESDGSEAEFSSDE